MYSSPEESSCNSSLSRTCVSEFLIGVDQATGANDTIGGIISGEDENNSLKIKCQ